MVFRLKSAKLIVLLYVKIYFAGHKHNPDKTPNSAGLWTAVWLLLWLQPSSVPHVLGSIGLVVMSCKVHFTSALT